MRAVDLLASGLTFAALAIATPRGLCHRAACNADNCARLVTGTRAGLPSTRMADCSSFMQATVTPAPVYITTTVTPVTSQDVTLTTETVVQYTTVSQSTFNIIRTGSNQVTARAVQANGTAAMTVSPTGMPQYAVASCSVASRYSSACSCAGVTKATTTLEAATIQTTVTAAPFTVSNAVAATTTVQQTIVATETGASKTGYSCGSTVQGNGIYSFRRYRVNCGQRVTSGQVGDSGKQDSESGCLRSCNSIKYCVYAEYQFSDGRCDLYFTPPSAIVDDSGVDALILT